MEQRRLVLDRIDAARSITGHPVVVGVSGFCGAGKSTLAREVLDRAEGAARMRGDDFLDPARSHRRSTDWDGVERDRLASEVLQPFRARRAGTFRRYDWSRRALGDLEALPRAEVLVVDLIGLFHPDVLALLDVTVWVDLDPGAAAERGRARDAALGRRHEHLWEEVWVPNDRDFAARFAPRAAAEVVIDNR